MIGENFKMLNRNNTEIMKIKEELENAKEAFTKYAKNTDDNNWNWDELHRLEKKAEILENNLWCAEYEDNRRRNWR